MGNKYLMTHSYLIETYLLLKIIRKHPKCIRLWLKDQIGKTGFSMHQRIFGNLINAMSNEGLIDLIIEEAKRGKSKHHIFLVITEKGLTKMKELELQFRIILTLGS